MAVDGFERDGLSDGVDDDGSVSLGHNPIIGNCCFGLPLEENEGDRAKHEADAQQSA
jgi:hypothetical protein